MEAMNLKLHRIILDNNLHDCIVSDFSELSWYFPGKNFIDKTSVVFSNIILSSDGVNEVFLIGWLLLISCFFFRIFRSSRAIVPRRHAAWIKNMVLKILFINFQSDCSARCSWAKKQPPHSYSILVVRCCPKMNQKWFRFPTLNIWSLLTSISPATWTLTHTGLSLPYI